MTTLRADASLDICSCLRFAVLGLPGPATRATPRVYATTSSSFGYAVHSVSDNTWQELTITLSDAPHIIEVDWRATTAAGANNGGLPLSKESTAAHAVDITLTRLSLTDKRTSQVTHNDEVHSCCHLLPVLSIGFT